MPRKRVGFPGPPWTGDCSSWAPRDRQDDACAGAREGMRHQVHRRQCGRLAVGGHLDSHLRAMRADFTEARRFAPAILFIDEIDSIGSRDSSAATTTPSTRPK